MAFGISENWIGKAERLDRFAYLIDLALGMSTRIARIGNEISDWTVGHDQARGRLQCSYFIHVKTPPKANDRRGFAPFENATESVQGEGEASAGRAECGARLVQGEASSGRGECRSRRVQGEASSRQREQVMVPLIYA